jgi:hypothetical protein
MNKGTENTNNSNENPQSNVICSTDLLEIIAGDTRLEHIRIARYNVKTAIQSLTDDYNRWDEVGKEHAVSSAVLQLEQAWKRLNVILSSNAQDKQPTNNL